MNRSLLIEAIDRDELTAAVADAVIARLRPLLTAVSTVETPKCATREEMAKLLRWSLAKLDRRTSDGAIPSVMDEGRRLYVIDDVLAALKEATPAAEAKARKRQAAKHAAKREAAQASGKNKAPTGR